MSNPDVKCSLTTAVWGTWHTNILLDVCLPSLLSPGNLPAFAKMVDAHYVIRTAKDDVTRIATAPVVRALRKHLPVSVEVASQIDVSDPIGSHVRVWNAANQDAKARGALVALIIPDLVWADGSFASVGRALKSGKRVIYAAFSRAVTETLVESVKTDFKGLDGTSLAISTAEMVQLAISHMHPLNAAYRRDSDHFPVHPQLMIWPVENEGFLNKYLLGEFLVFDPQADLTTAYALKSVDDLNTLKFFDRSDELMALSITGLRKDVDWYTPARTANPVSAARWWLDCDSPANDFCIRQNIRFHTGTMTEARWRRREQQADIYMQRVVANREMLRVLDWLKHMRFDGGARILASAISSARLGSRWPWLKPAILLVPLSLSPGGRLTDLETKLLAAGNESLLREFISSHAVELTPAVQAVIDGVSNGTIATTVNGHPIQVRRKNGWVNFGRARIVTGQFAVGRNTVFGINRPIRDI